MKPKPSIMKPKTIRKVIANKLNHWLESIEDKKLREDVKKNVIVSGGAIASMLLKEKVNDYDLYLQDIDVLERLAQYYCKGLGVGVLDGRRREDYLEKYPNSIDESSAGIRYIRLSNLKPNQIKLEINGAGIKPEASKDKKKKYQPQFLSPNAISLEGDIQIVLRFSGTVEEIHESFDFVHATNYFSFTEGLVLNNEALQSLIAKDLKYRGSLYPLTSIIRMKKFIQRGWTISAGEILKIMFQISQLDLTDISILEEQLIGVDVAYFGKLLDKLKGVDKGGITSDMIGKMIDEVFDEQEDLINEE